ncbi:hypothetical protein [Haloechinothrix salitolerans]|uniref:HPr Serine kinase C-terminal domain-containing protein n=1 Tax=Haloechinothrix salitolerans TaxID=926830 RepID=A0ABW2C3H9_9PSEU
MTYQYRAHGLDVVSEIELPLPPGDTTSIGTRSAAEPDLVLRRGPGRPVRPEPPDGTLVATLTDADGALRYGIARAGAGVVLRYPGLCEFVGDQDFGEVTAYPHPNVDDGYLPVLATGMMLALHLILRGELVLHASAVRDGDAAIAFVGASGMGKSTLATALCRDGCSLLADDVLRVERHEAAGRHEAAVRREAAGMRVYPGSAETRLRPGAELLANGARTRRTADGRLAVRLDRAVGAVPGRVSGGVPASPVPLALCVVPRPDRGATELAVERLAPARALLLLSRFPRVLGWREPDALATTFHGLADLVERVPVVLATIPWGDALDGVLPALRDTMAATTAPVQR